MNAADSLTARLTEQRANIAARLTAAHEASEPLRLCGAGGWLAAGRPVHATSPLSSAPFADIIEYVPGDLVITLGSGVPLATLQEVASEHGQWFALDPAGDPNSTIGATVATATSGPLSLGSGAIRDLVLGLGLVTGTGTSIRVGGRVVKNVAGFDLVRLNTGACGTLGFITDISLRLHARPATDVTLAIAHDEMEALLTVHARLGHASLSFHALELLDPSLAQSVGAGSGSQWVLLARATGNAAAIAAQRLSLSILGTVHEVDGAVWGALQQADGDGATFRVSAPPAHIGRTIMQTQRALAAAGIAHAQLRATPYRGAVRVIARADRGRGDAWVVALHTALEQLQLHVHRVIGERLPARAWRALPAAAEDPISTRIRDAFDPKRILNRGIFGEPAP